MKFSLHLHQEIAPNWFQSFDSADETGNFVDHSFSSQENLSTKKAEEISLSVIVLVFLELNIKKQHFNLLYVIQHCEAGYMGRSTGKDTKHNCLSLVMEVY